MDTGRQFGYLDLKPAKRRHCFTLGLFLRMEIKPCLLDVVLYIVLQKKTIKVLPVASILYLYLVRMANDVNIYSKSWKDY